MDKSVKKGLYLSFLFLVIIFFFSYELPNLQRILNINIYSIMSLLLAVSACYFLTMKIDPIPDIRERITIIGFIFVLQLLFWLSFPSFINRTFLKSQTQAVSVDKISLEWSSMFGMMESEKMNLEPTHVRLLFSHNQKTYNRAFKIDHIDLERIAEDEVNVFISKGLLGYTIIN